MSQSSDATHGVLARLREFVAAVDRRAPRPERPAENRIASEAADLKQQALDRIAQLEMPDPS